MNSGFDVCFLYLSSPEHYFTKKIFFKVQVVHSYCYIISSLSGREYYNQHYNVNSSSLNICFTYMYFKIIMLIGKRNLQRREWCHRTLPIVLRLSHPFFPFPVKSCKKFKADEVYCWRKKLFLKIKVKKTFYSALLLKKDYSTINLVLEKSRKDTICMYHTMSSISRMAFC